MAGATETYDVIAFNGTRYPIVPGPGSVGYQNLARWQGKTVLGDYTRDSDEIISSKIWTSFLGGIGIDRIREGSDEGRCWWGTLNMRHPYQLALNWRAVAVTTARYPLGDLADVFYAADADQVFAWNESTDALGAALAGTLTTPPIWKGTSWNGYQYIPLGSGGYAYHDGTTVTEVTTDIDVQRFIGWDNRLIAVTPTGEICESFSSPAVAATWGQVADINSSESVQNVVVYTDRSDNETLYVVTDRNTYAYDPITQILIRTRLQLPPHPDNGQGAAVWRPGEDLFVSSGIGVYRFNLSVIAPIGLDRDQGIPSEYRGVIKDLEPSHNLLVAYLEGQQTVSAVTDTVEFDPGQLGEDGNVAGSDAYSVLVGFNGFGWHPLWVSPDASGTPVWCVTSGAANAYRLWWGYGTGTNDKLYTMELSRSFANPSQLIETSEGDFAASGFLDTGWFDANMREFTKVASHLEVNVETASATETITVSYKTDFDTSWTLLGNIAASGRTDLPFGVVAYNGFDFSYGLEFRRLRFKIEMTRDPSDSSKSPLIDSIVLKYLKVPLNTPTYQFRIPLDLEDFEGRGPDAIAEELEDLITSSSFIVMEHGQATHDPHRVRLSYLAGRESVGGDPRNYRDITVVEVPLLSYQGRGAE